MTTLMQASHQWSSRPRDQRFLNLNELHAKVDHVRQNSVASAVANRRIEVQPHHADGRRGIQVFIDDDKRVDIETPTHWSFGQLAALSGAPAGYLRQLPAPIVADCMNYGLRFKRDVESVGLMSYHNTYIGEDGVELKSTELRAATGPNYGRIWNSDITASLIEKFGDGVTGDWKVPGEFGKDVPITRENTTIYGSDRDMFVFLADEKNRIDMTGRRNGEPGSLARGFFVWNSEVGNGTMGAAFFLFDYVCMNRIVWGVKEFTETRIRHTKGAPDRWLEEITPVLLAYSNSAAGPVEQTIKAAQQKKVDDDLDAFLGARYNKGQVASIKQAHEREEGRPIETVWDAVTGATAYAKSINWQDERVAIERTAGKMLDLVAA